MNAQGDEDLGELMDDLEQEGWLPELRAAMEADQRAASDAVVITGCPHILRLARAH